MEKCCRFRNVRDIHTSLELKFKLGGTDDIGLYSISPLSFKIKNLKIRKDMTESKMEKNLANTVMSLANIQIENEL